MICCGAVAGRRLNRPAGPHLINHDQWQKEQQAHQRECARLEIARPGARIFRPRLSPARPGGCPRQSVPPGSSAVPPAAAPPIRSGPTAFGSAGSWQTRVICTDLLPRNCPSLPEELVLPLHLDQHVALDRLVGGDMSPACRTSRSFSLIVVCARNARISTGALFTFRVSLRR